MRNTLFALMLSAAGLFGLAAIPSTAQADARIYVDLGDVFFSYGRPHYRYDRAPLYVTYDGYGHPRYYRYAPRRVYRSNYYGGYYDPYYNGRVVVRPRVVYGSGYRHGYRHGYYNDRHRGHRGHGHDRRYDRRH